MPSQFDNLSDEELALTISSDESELEIISARIKQGKHALIERKQADINDALSKKPEPFGAVSQVVGAKKVTFTTPKKVEWDQQGLAALYKQIDSDPQENIEEYISIEYKVKEDAYKNWPSNLKECFEPHRTVKPGNIAVKIEPAKEK